MDTPEEMNPARKSGSRTMIDLFAGCGGLSLGFEMEGFHPLLFSEINLSAASTYMVNRRGSGVIPVGDIYSLGNDNLALLKKKWELEGITDIDVVAGGPPCQGFSGIGHRRTFKLQKEEIPSNHLFHEMVRVVAFLRPRVFLFENVKGLLSGRWTNDGEKGEIFRDVIAGFSTLEGYTARWDLLQARDYGVPQNRPRVVIIGYRDDVAPHASSQGELGISSSLGIPDGARKQGFLPAGSGKPPTLEELLGDLVDPAYSNGGSTNRYPSEPASQIQEWLRRTPGGDLMGKDHEITDHVYSRHKDWVSEKYRHMIAHGGEIPEHLKTKKFAMRVLPRSWEGNGPNITATSLPEDFVHYEQPRTPTVREWARLQTFPDWYRFEGPRTTGGRRRAGDPEAGNWDREVPKYTQIGNAVPVLMARAIARHLNSILGTHE